jgi:hypothetical protein
MRYSTDQAELLMSFAAVMIFAGLWLPFIDRLARPLEQWVRVSLAVLPILLFIAALVYYWRKFRL